jgi:predicted ester cyclase
VSFCLIASSGTHQGAFQGIPATGRTISYVSDEFYRVADGLVAEEWICSDMASIFLPVALSQSTMPPRPHPEAA